MRKITLLFALLLAFVGMAKAQESSTDVYATTPGVEVQLSTAGGTQYVYYVRDVTSSASGDVFLKAASTSNDEFVRFTSSSSEAMRVVFEGTNASSVGAFVLDAEGNKTHKWRSGGAVWLWIQNNPDSRTSADFNTALEKQTDESNGILYKISGTSRSGQYFYRGSNNGSAVRNNLSNAGDNWQFIPANDAAKEAADWPKVTMLPGDATHGNLTTFSSTKPVVCPDDYQVFTAIYSDNTLNLEEVADRVIPANTGVIVKGDEGSFFMVPNATENTLTSALTPTGTEGKTVAEGENIFGLGLQDATLGFYKVKENTTIGAGKAYLASSQGGSAIALNFGGTTTGVHSVSASTENQAPVFDLSGRRVQSVVKGGVYIQNGKKFIK